MSYKVLDVPQSLNCQHCVPCMRIRLMEMGFIEGQEIEIENKRMGLYIVHMLSDNGTVSQTFALRPEELGRICLKENDENI
jgi:Fe2+ transport system protein FeoA